MVKKTGLRNRFGALQTIEEQQHQRETEIAAGRAEGERQVKNYRRKSNTYVLILQKSWEKKKKEKNIDQICFMLGKNYYREQFTKRARTHHSLFFFFFNNK